MAIFIAVFAICQMSIATLYAGPHDSYKGQHKKMFKNADKDGDKALNQEEFKSFIEAKRKFREEMKKKYETTNLAEAFKDADVDADGKVTKKELKKYKQKMHEMREEMQEKMR